METISETPKKPVCQLSGTDGNVFALLGRVTLALKKAGQREKAEEVAEKVFTCASYEEALGLFEEYVDVH